MTVKVSLDKLLESGAHFGHQARRWNPKMEEYLFTVQDNVHVFDLVKTKAMLEEAMDYVTKTISEGKRVLLLGTKKQIKEKVLKIGQNLSIPYVSERWLGGAFSNFDQIKRSIKKLRDLKEKTANGEFNAYTKKERLLISREIERLERFFGGISSLESLPEAIFIVDVHKENSAVKEALRNGVKIVGIVDSNSDPTSIDYPIPMNDDSSKALDYVLDLFEEAVKDGLSKESKAREKSEKAIKVDIKI